LHSGWTRAQVRANLDVHRWQTCGRAVVLHNGPLHPDELPEVAVLNCGPRAALTAFTAAARCGLKGWDRNATNVLVPAGARIRLVAGVPLRVHWSGDWAGEDVSPGRHALAPGLLIAAGTFAGARPACGILAAAVQQRLLTAAALQAALDKRPRTRHHRAMALAIGDIAQGAEAPSEIDFARLCRRHGLPEPVRQAVRVEPSGRRRYLDSEWRTRTGRRAVAEVDGALHLAPRRWWADQLRQNELVIKGDLVLRFPASYSGMTSSSSRISSPGSSPSRRSCCTLAALTAHEQHRQRRAYGTRMVSASGTTVTSTGNGPRYSPSA
jgi:hypothetical protein